ncbi:MAG TPA: AlkA N-terminal domain-containing protein [Thermoanaerobaculia bacterium]|jgi:AraC family transcriptional regulator of adaptative response / DNA-3-methyladenine glycosylase II|nr:AlkA N-terminal domain-containing protein [Thermoanaerobaculia bacterium]
MELDPKICDRARLARDSRFDGRFFIAVLSTGIYCRAICPSPPARRENVRYFRSAAEAVEAGYRPCLRCRPETAPGTPAWNGTSTTVKRALRLIAEGALQEDRVTDLSERLGVSARHLDRLFRIHLGASPAAVARASRLHFAKQLISDTNLPMFRVALASGFRSVRRFNDSIRGLYGRTPSQLRRMRPVARRARPDEYVFRLSYRAPYDWESLLAFLANRAIPGVEEVVAGTYRRSFALDGQHGILEVRHEESTQALEARIRFSEPVSLLPIVTRLRAMFDLAADPSVIAQHFRRDLLLGRLVKKYPGLRVPGAWDGFELGVRAILGQQVTVAAASTLAGQLAKKHGERLTVPDSGGLTVVFPTPRVLAGIRLTGLPRVRARAIRSLAQAVVSGRLTFSGTEEETLDTLVGIRGIGEWTAQYIAMRALRQPDAFPVNDLVLLRSAGRGRPLTAAALRKRAEQWRPWRAYAALLLWRDSADLARAADPPERIAAGR